MATLLSTLRLTARARLMETLALTTPGSPLVAPQGVTGATTITYKIVATNASGHSDVSQPTTVTNANATLTVGNFNQINWQAVPGATGYDVYRSATNGLSPLTVGKIGSTAATTLNDTGLVGDTTIAPLTNTSGIDSPFWTEQELLDLLIAGCQDLWKAIADLHQGHFVKIEDPATGGTMVYPAGASGVTTDFTGVPADCFRVLMIEPANLGANGVGATVVRQFRPKQFHSTSFQEARAMSVQDSFTWWTIYYDLLNAGSPVDTIRIVGAPPVSAAIPIRMTYVKTLPTLLETDNNPIPGESNSALIAWVVAYAKAKENAERIPDAGWLAIYSTEKQGLLVALTPRQEQEEEEVTGMFEYGW
jgi:hypothetical protein